MTIRLLMLLLTTLSVRAQLVPTTPKPARVRITQGPEIELSKDFLTIIRWETNNPGGSPVHYGVVHYGTDPKHLDQSSRSPIHLNPDHALTTFRVRMLEMKPGTTYYYRVDSSEANGKSDGVISDIKRFTTPPKGGS